MDRIWTTSGPHRRDPLKWTVRRSGIWPKRTGSASERLPHNWGFQRPRWHVSWPKPKLQQQATARMGRSYRGGYCPPSEETRDQPHDGTIAPSDSSPGSYNRQRTDIAVRCISGPPKGRRTADSGYASPEPTTNWLHPQPRFGYARVFRATPLYGFPERS